MRNYHYYTLCIIGISCILLSCTPNENKDAKLSFPLSIDLVGEEILPDAVGIGSIRSINNYLIAKTMDQDYCFTVYSLDSLKELGKVVKKGDGPGEFPSSARFDYTMTTGNSSYLWAHDLNYPTLSKINLDKSLKKGKTIIQDTVRLPFEDSFVKAFKISNDKIIGRSGNTVPSMGRLKIYNPEIKEVTKVVPFFPEVETSRTDYDFIINKLNSIYVGSLTMKPDGTKIASAMNSFNQIDIFDTNAELLVSIKDDFSAGENRMQQYLKDDNLDWKHLMGYYGGICSTEDFIFALFRNQLGEDYGKKMIPVTIRVFDWEGAPIAELKVPDYLFSIAIDEQNGYLIGSSYFEEKMMRYDIKDFLDESI